MLRKAKLYPRQYEMCSCNYEGWLKFLLSDCSQSDELVGYYQHDGDSIAKISDKEEILAHLVLYCYDINIKYMDAIEEKRKPAIYCEHGRVHIFGCVELAEDKECEYGDYFIKSSLFDVALDGSEEVDELLRSMKGQHVEACGYLEIDLWDEIFGS